MSQTESGSRGSVSRNHGADAIVLESLPRLQAAWAALAAGQPVVFAEDAPDGVAIAAISSALVTPQGLNDLVTICGGVVAATIDAARADALALPLLTRRRVAPSTPLYTVSVEAATGVSTGISAADRAATVQALAAPTTAAADLVRPGHIMPIAVDPLGVLRRPFAVEAAHDFARVGGQTGGVTLSHLLHGHDEVPARDAQAFAAARGWLAVRVSEVAAWRAGHEEFVTTVEQAELAAEGGNTCVEVCRSDLDGGAHLVLATGRLGADARAPLVRIHSQCLTGDILHSLRCDCGTQLQQALRAIHQDGHGAVLYLSQEGRGIGLEGKVRAYALQDKGRDTVDANLELGFAPDQRDYAVAVQLLRQRGVRQVRLLTNNPDKVQALARLGVEVVEVVPLRVAPDPWNIEYLRTKQRRLGHDLRLGDGG